VRARPETTLVQVTAAVQRRENVRVRTEKIEREDVLVKRKLSERMCW
jgi:molybdopterin biosynthesis enzyme